MCEFMTTLLHMELTASCTILAVLTIRFILQKAQKKYAYYLWSVVAFRLCCPVSFSSAFSLFNLIFPGGSPFASTGSAGFSAVQDGTAAASGDGVFYTLNGAAGGNSLFSAPDGAAGGNSLFSAPGVGADGNGLFSSLQNAVSGQTVLFLATILWLTGVFALLAYGIAAYIRLAGKLRTAIRLKDNVYQSEYVHSPFILGLVRPKIYIPFHLDGQTLHYVLLHENYHLRRHDHILKIIAYLLLAVHWFNPLCWLSFHLFGKDMEMSCDEHVLSQGEDISSDYSDALLSFALRRRFPAPSPLAFGETDMKERVLHILNWKRPRLATSLFAAIICLGVIFTCASDPAASIPESSESSYDPIAENFPENSHEPDTENLPEGSYEPDAEDFRENDDGSENDTFYPETHHAESHHSDQHHAE